MSRITLLLTSLLVLALKVGWGQSLSLVDKDGGSLKLGGYLRFNYAYDPEDASYHKGGGQFYYDVFGLKVQAGYKRLSLEASYLFYDKSMGGHYLRSGWLGYRLGDRHQLQLGLVPNALGVYPIGSNSFLYNMHFLFGLEDDSDPGIRYTYRDRGWMLSAGWATGSEFTSSGEAVSVSRFGFDLSGEHRESNQLNLYVHREWQTGGGFSHLVGASLIYGDLRHIETHERSDRNILALHYVGRYRGWTLKGQFARYDIKAYDAQGNRSSLIHMAGQGAVIELAARANVYLLSLSHHFPIKGSFVDGVTVYNDLSVMDKDLPGSSKSLQNILGCFVKAGPVETYVDLALLRNHAFWGEAKSNAFSYGSSDAKLTPYLRVNIGYYF